MGNGKKVLAGCLLIMAVGLGMTGCGRNGDGMTNNGSQTNTNQTSTNQTETGRNTQTNSGAAENGNATNDTNNTTNTDNRVNNNTTNDGTLENVGEDIGAAGDDLLNGAADAVDRLADDGIDSENNVNSTDTGVQ